MIESIRRAPWLQAQMSGDGLQECLKSGIAVDSSGVQGVEGSSRWTEIGKDLDQAAVGEGLRTDYVRELCDSQAVAADVESHCFQTAGKARDQRCARCGA